MSSVEDLSYHHLGAGVNSQTSPAMNGNAAAAALKRKKGRRPKGLENGPGNFGPNGSGMGQPTTKRKSRESKHC